MAEFAIDKRASKATALQIAVVGYAVQGTKAHLICAAYCLPIVATPGADSPQRFCC